MKNFLKKIFFVSVFILLFSIFSSKIYVQAAEPIPTPTPDAFLIVCGCPTELASVNSSRGEKCVGDYETFKQSPTTNHLWVEDPDVTAQGKADDRARQFIYWAINTSSIDTHPTLTLIWNAARNVAYFMVILVAAILGIGMIIAQRSSFNTKIQVWPSVFKVLLILLYITFSATLVIVVIQLSEVLMKFFIETLGGKDLFNIDFAAVSNEKSYLGFAGCRDLNIRVQESVQAEMFLLKLTNVTYYVMGTMIILRKILLWFLLFVSPFLGILMPFIFIRNIGWIWIGVFFQWVFYGPLFALFLGALATIWKYGIPYLFDFSRGSTLGGYIYPTAINILYAGPSHRPAIMNNGNYVDTFAEYVITLIMLWAVTFFPWWLLRIFRDYCCEGIIAMKNILLSMYDQSRGTPPAPPTPTPTPMTISTTLKMPQEIPIRVKLETTAQIKQASTTEITKALNIQATKLTDVARFETSKQTQQNFNKNINYLKNPTQADTTMERQRFMSIRTELFNRAIKQDTVAKQVLSTVTASKVEQIQKRDEILHTIPQMVPVTKVVSIRIRMPTDKIQSVTSLVVRTVSTNPQLVATIATATKLQSSQVQTILTALTENINEPPNKIVDIIAQKTNISKENVVKVVQAFTQSVTTNKELTASVAQKENIKEEEVTKVVEAQMPFISDPLKNIEQTVSIPPTVSLEDYEQVKSMWKEQYEKGEVPVTENIKTREAWVDQDIVTITNTLNKLLSGEDKMRQEGLDEVGYILPIFLINNLKGGELAVYLKAKLEAAKTVQEEKVKEKEIEEKVKEKATEEFVEVAKPKEAEEEKTMEMKEEMKIDEKPEEKKSQ